MTTNPTLDDTGCPILGYAAVIHEATGITNRVDLEAIEDSMRNDIFHSTLDWQTRAQLRAGALEAWEIVQIMRDPVALRLALGMEADATV